MVCGGLFLSGIMLVWLGKVGTFLVRGSLLVYFLVTGVGKVGIFLVKGSFLVYLCCCMFVYVFVFPLNCDSVE